MVEQQMINHMKKSVHDTITWVKDAPLASRQLGFTTGCMLAFGGFVMGIIHFFNLNFVKALLDFAIFFTGGCACAIEYKGMFLYFIGQIQTLLSIYISKPNLISFTHLIILYRWYPLYCIVLYCIQMHFCHQLLKSISKKICSSFSDRLVDRWSICFGAFTSLSRGRMEVLLGMREWSWELQCFVLQSSRFIILL